MKIEQLSNSIVDEAKNYMYGNCNWSDDLSGNLYTDVHALILTKEEHEKIQKAQISIVSLLHKVQNILYHQPELNEWLGIQDNLRPIIQKEIQALTTYGRFDWMFDGKGELNVLEFNAETPMGWKEACEYNLKAHKYYSKYQCMNMNLATLLKESIQNTLNSYGDIGRGRIAVVGDLDDIEEQDTFSFLADITKQINPNVMICNVSDLKVLTGYLEVEDGVYLERGNELYPIDVLQTFYSIEWLSEDEGGQKLINLIRDNRVKLMNPTSTLQIHSKGIWALIWFLLLETELLKEYEQVIWSYIPYATFDANEFKELMKDKYVKKPLSHREGDGIEIKSTSDIETDDLYVYQEFIDSTPVFFPRMKNGSRQYIEMIPTIGTYCIGDKFGGYMTRISEGVCSAFDATFTPTFVEMK